MPVYPHPWSNCNIASSSPHLTAASVSTPSRRTVRPTTLTRQRRLRWIVTGVGILVTGVITVAFIRGQGAITGTDFSPTHFTTRHYSFIEIPWIGLQITPIRRVDTTSDALQYLRTSGMIPRLRPNQKTWHPSTIRRGFSTTVQHDSQLLIDQLALTDQSKPYWEQWSNAHPEKARVLWPLIAKLAQRELYVLMPGIFNLAQRQKSDEKFSDQLDRYLTQEYAELVSDMRAAGRLDLAEQLEREAEEFSTSPDEELNPAH